MKILLTQLSTAFFLVLMLPCVLHAGTGKPSDMNMTETVILHRQSTTCGGITQSQWISSQQSYQTALQSLKKGTISSSSADSLSIDFAKSAVLVISMGQQRTGGFSVTLASKQMQIEKDRATIRVQWTEAKPGMITIQMLTNPCLVLEVPRAKYSYVDIVDQAGKLRETIAVE